MVSYPRLVNLLGLTELGKSKGKEKEQRNVGIEKALPSERRPRGNPMERSHWDLLMERPKALMKGH